MRLVLLAVFATGVAGASGGDVALACLVLVVLLTASGGTDWRRLWDGVRRLRYFYLSLFVLYGWLDGGQPLLPALGAWSPSQEGVIEGLLRATALALIVAAVQWLFTVSSRGELVAGLRWLMRPAARLGVPAERVALRLVLSMELVPRLQTMAGECARQASPGGRLSRLSQTAGGLFAAALAEAESAEPPRVELTTVGRPLAVEWLAPISLITIFTAF